VGLILSFLFGFLPMLAFAWFVFWLDHYEKEPKLLLGGIFIWGAIVAAGGAFLVNTFLGLGVYIFSNSERFTELTTGSLIAPLVEESLKGVAVLAVFWFFRREFDSILDGIIYASIAALGFAASENVYYIYQYGFLENGYEGLFALIFVRVILVGWQHPFYTSFIGIGLAITRMNRNVAVQFGAPLLGWVLAVLTHSLHNTLASLLSGVAGLAISTIVDWTGWIFMFFVIILATHSERRYISLHLEEEVNLGNISPAEYRIACSAWAQFIARLTSLLSGNYRDTNQFYQLTAELAHKKHQRSKMGEEENNSMAIYKLRTDLKRLSQRVSVF